MNRSVEATATSSEAPMSTALRAGPPPRSRCRPACARWVLHLMQAGRRRQVQRHVAARAAKACRRQMARWRPSYLMLVLQGADCATLPEALVCLDSPFAAGGCGQAALCAGQPAPACAQLVLGSSSHCHAVLRMGMSQCVLSWLVFVTVAVRCVSRRRVQLRSSWKTFEIYVELTAPSPSAAASRASRCSSCSELTSQGCEDATHARNAGLAERINI